MWSKDDIREVAAEEAMTTLGPVIDRNAAIGNGTISRVTDLEQKVSELERENDELRYEIDRLHSQLRLID